MLTNFLKTKFIPVILILGLGLVIRLVNIHSIPIFADEAIYVRWAQVMRTEPSLRFLPLSDGKQPLYMWSVIPFFKLISDPLVAGRFVASLLGVGTILGVIVASQLIFKNWRLSLIAGLLYSVLPYSVFFDRLALADSMLACFLLWAFIFMYFSVRTIRYDWAMVSGFAFGFALLTKSPGMIGFGLLPLAAILKEKGFSLPGWLRTLSQVLVAFCIGYAMYNILRLGPEFHMIALRNRDYVYSLSEILRHPLDPLITNLKASVNFYFYLATPGFIVLFIFGLLDWRKSHKLPRLVLALACLAPIFAQSAIAKTFTARYLLYTVPFATIVVAHALEHLSQHTKKHFLLPIAAVLILGPSLWSDYQLLYHPENMPLPRIERAGYLEEWTAGFGLQEIAQTIISQNPNKSVIIGSEGFFGTPFDALQLYTNNHSNIRTVGVGVWIESVSDKLQNAKKDNQVYLVVNSSRFHISDPKKAGLELIGSYPKAVPPSGDREYTLFFKVN